VSVGGTLRFLNHAIPLAVTIIEPADGALKVTEPQENHVWLPDGIVVFNNSLKAISCPAVAWTAAIAISSTEVITTIIPLPLSLMEALPGLNEISAG